MVKEVLFSYQIFGYSFPWKWSLKGGLNVPRRLAVHIVRCSLHQIAVATTTSVDLHILLLWIYYHRRLGVDTFYIFVEGELESPEKRSILRSIPVSMPQALLSIPWRWGLFYTFFG
ncbi:hypothetical protein Mapa_013153 [Marchantia paleacea]|nr:hypothetical protein Mapa_013153 [Marchantia paleacea]